MDDLYHILQVDPIADPEVVEAAYRQLARKYHPDVYKESDATTRMQALNDAYAVLRDPARRSAYDRKRAGLIERRGGSAMPPGAAPVSPWGRTDSAPAGAAQQPAHTPVPPENVAVRARERARRQKISELNATIQQLQDELDQALAVHGQQRIRIGLVYVLGALLIAAFTLLNAGAPHMTGTLHATALITAGVVGLAGLALMVRAFYTLRRQLDHIAGLRSQIRRRRHELNRK